MEPKRKKARPPDIERAPKGQGLGQRQDIACGHCRKPAVHGIISVADGMTGETGRLRPLGADLFHLSFPNFADILPGSALAALIRVGLITCKCARCNGGAR